HCQAGNGAERRPMQMVEMCMRDQDRVNRGQVTKPQPGSTKALQNENPAGEVRVDQEVLATYLYEQAEVSDECTPQLSAFGKNRFASKTGARSHRRMVRQLCELPGLSADCYTNHVLTN